MTLIRFVLGSLLILQVATTGCGGGSELPRLEPGPTCIAFCAKAVAECDALADLQGFEDVDEATCQQVCERNILNERVVLETCGDAVEAVFECASMLECPDFEAWLAREPEDAFPCRSEVLATDEACPSI